MVYYSRVKEGDFRVSGIANGKGKKINIPINKYNDSIVDDNHYVYAFIRIVLPILE